MVLIEPGELFSLTPMGSKQSRHYQTMKEERDHNPKEANKIENLQNFFGSLNPGLGLISEEHGVYRWDYMSGWLGILTSKLMFQTISRGSSLGKSWKTLLRHLPFTKVQLSVLIIIGFFGGNCRTFQATGKTNGVFSLQDRRQIEETASWIRYMKTGPPLKEIFYVYLLFVVPVKRNFLLLIFMFYCYSQTIKFN